MENDNSASPLCEIPFPHQDNNFTHDGTRDGTRRGAPPLMMMPENMLQPALTQSSAEKFDLMDIEITVYSLTGISCSATSSSAEKQGRRLINKSRERIHTGRGIPITGVVSFRRNVVSSGTMIETFLPSESLKLPLLPKPDTVSKQTASWTSNPSSALLNSENQTSYATYSVKRVMQRQAYQRDLSIRDVGNYAPETIEVKVGVGRGKEIIPLGIASISITGEEEGEIFTNVPVKDLAPEKDKRKTFRPKAGRTKKNRKKKRRAAIFSGDPNWCFGLEENATLRVGVKVVPSEIKQSNEERRLRTEKSLDEILEGLYDENLIIELNDENSLLEKFVGRSDQEEGKVSKEEPAQVPESKSIFANFFCGMLPLCADASTVDDRTHDNAPSNKEENQVRGEIKVGSKKTEAIVLSLSLMSSVSESTFGSELETPVSGMQSPGFKF